MLSDEPERARLDESDGVSTNWRPSGPNGKQTAQQVPTEPEGERRRGKRTRPPRSLTK